MSEAPANSVEVPFQDIYANSLKHQTAAIQEQVEAGLYSLKRYAYYLQKLALALRPTLKDMIKDTEHENEKKQRAEKDRMTNHVSAYRRMQDVQLEVLNSELKYVQATLDEVAEPMLAWHKNAEKKRDALVKKEAQIHKEYKEMLSKVAAQRVSCLKQWGVLQAAKREVAKAEVGKDTKKNGLKDLQKAEQNYDKERIKTEQMFKQLENAVQTSNASQNQYWNKDLPGVVQEWERLEVERLSVMGSHMNTYARLQRARVTPQDSAAATLEEGARLLDGPTEMKEFVSSIVRTQGSPTNPSTIEDQLPCSSQLLARDSEELTQVLNLEVNVAVLKRDIGSGSGSASASFSTSSAGPAGGPGTEASSSSSSSSSSFSAPASSGPSPDQPARDGVICYVKALYTFAPTDTTDLPFKEGDVVAVLQQAPPEDDQGAWWVGAVVQEDGSLSNTGSFPSNYCEPYNA